MADVTVKVEMKPGWKGKLMTLPRVKGAVTSKASAICGTANSLGAGFTTKKYYDREDKEYKGGTQASYRFDKAQVFISQTDGPVSVAIVYTANYAAMKDNYLHNTLLKAVPNG